MTNEKMEQRLAAALEKTAPDDVNGVLSRCEARKGTVIPMTTKKTSNRKWTTLIAACLAVMLLGGGKDRAKRCERRSLSLRRAERNGNSHDNKENDEEKMDITHCRLPCGDAARRRAVLPAGKRGGLRGVAGREPEH